MASGDITRAEEQHSRQSGPESCHASGGDVAPAYDLSTLHHIRRWCPQSAETSTFPGGGAAYIHQLCRIDIIHAAQLQ